MSTPNVKKMHALDRAIKWAGGIVPLANRLGIDRSNVSHWKRTGRVAYRHRIRIEEITGGEIKARDFD